MKHFYQLLTKKMPGHAFVIMVLLASLCWHLDGRDKHYQEMDSTQVYDNIYRFPAPADGYVNGWGKSQNKQVAKKNIALFEKVKRTELPFALKCAFIFPLSSTYCFGTGFVIGLITDPSTAYHDFVHKVLFLHIFLFHLAALLLYFILRRIHISFTASLLAVLMFIFSISLYSYASHMGSTVWNIVTSFIWIFCFVVPRTERGRYRAVDIATGILFFFNYLIVLYWLGYLLQYILRNKKVLFTVKFIGNSFARNWFSLIMLVVCTVMFYQPGQGLRGNIDSLQKLLITPYYIILNFFSFYNHSRLADILQFVAFLGIFAGGIFLSAKQVISEKKTEKSDLSFLLQYSFLFTLIFAAFILFKLLGLAPSRHILFAVPVVFLWVAVLFDRVITKNNYPAIGIVVVFVICIAGIFSLNERKNDMENRIGNISFAQAEPGIDSVVIINDFSNAKPILYSTPFAKLICRNPAELVNDKKYVYFSQETPFDTYLLSIGKDPLRVKKYGQYAFANDFGFIAYDPYHFNYNRQNKIFYCVFSLPAPGGN